MGSRPTSSTNNIVHKLFNREILGSTSGKPNDRSQKMFEGIPPQLRFCLMDIVPLSYLRHHAIMGLSQCGKYLLSFTYNYHIEYLTDKLQFTLHFLSWVPGRKASKVHSVPLFGGEFLDCDTTISMAQWKHNPAVLVVYGVVNSSPESSCLSVVGVPRLECKKCFAYSKNAEDAPMCLEHNFAVHTKYLCKSYCINEPVVRLAYSNHIIICTDFIHILEIDIWNPAQERNETVEDFNPSTPASDVTAVQNISYDSELKIYQLSSGSEHDIFHSPTDSDHELDSEHKIYQLSSDSKHDIHIKPSSSAMSECDHDDSKSEYSVTEMLDDGSLETIAVDNSASKTRSECPVSPQEPYLVHSANSNCSKFFTRYFVDTDDDITSVITDSEDESGYYVALHLTAHGAGDAVLQPVSCVSWSRLRPHRTQPTLRATQRSLNIELLCYEVCDRLCQINGKKFICCFDWGCHVIDVCHISGCLTGVCAMWLWASDEMSTCAKCERERDVSFAAACPAHQIQYAAECLFAWDVVTGKYRTERVDMTKNDCPSVKRESAATRAQCLAKRIGPTSTLPGSEIRLLQFCLNGSHKYPRILTDLDHCIQITKKQSYLYWDAYSESESEPDFFTIDEESDSD